MSRVLIATLGFDERHVVRSMLRLGFGGVEKIVLLVPRGGVEERTKRAIEEIERLASIAGVTEIIVEEIPTEDFVDSVATIYGLLKKALSMEREVMVSLGGGLRALVIETLVAVFMLPRKDRDRVEVVSDLETGRGSISFRASLLPFVSPSFSEIEEKILRYLKDRGCRSLTDISEGLSIPRSTAWKGIDRLRDMELVVKTNGCYRLTEKGLLVAKVISSQ